MRKILFCIAFGLKIAEIQAKYSDFSQGALKVKIFATYIFFRVAKLEQKETESTMEKDDSDYKWGIGKFPRTRHFDTLL